MRQFETDFFHRASPRFASNLSEIDARGSRKKVATLSQNSHYVFRCVLASLKEGAAKKQRRSLRLSDVIYRNIFSFLLASFLT